MLLWGVHVLSIRKVIIIDWSFFLFWKDLLVDETMLNQKSVKGFVSWKRFQEGSHITRKQAILAKCYDCMGYYADFGLDKDCKVKDCPLYPYHPYRSRTVQETLQE